MGWANCGDDSNGRPIGYAHTATCDHPGCTKQIDRGLAYACGGMHGDEYGCERYVCGEHTRYAKVEVWPGEVGGFVCFECAKSTKRKAKP